MTAATGPQPHRQARALLGLSQFLVLMNRILALMVAGVYCILCKQLTWEDLHTFSTHCNLSNVLSSWC